MTRQVAWEVLRSGSPVPTREVDRLALAAGLDPRDRALVRRIVATEIRRRGTLRALVNAFTRKRPKPELIAHLHIGLVQVLFLDRVPDHAALSTTSDAVARTVGPSKVPFVNGLLRTVLRARCEGHSGDPRCDLVGRNLHIDHPVFRDPEQHPLLWAEDALSIPATLMKRWAKRHGNETADALARGFLQEPPLVLRTYAERDAVLAELIAAGIDAEPGPSPRTLVCGRGSKPLPGAEDPSDEAEDETTPDPTRSVTETAAFREGRVTIQGETAAFAAELMEAQSEERILDVCAAPGGKSAILAERGARVLGLDRDPRRLIRAVETCARLGAGERTRFVASDGSQALAQPADGQATLAAFDGVLVDAPCSNTGVLGARPEARWRFGPQTLASLGELQWRLLNEGATHVRPGGRLVWSTCSLEPEENERLMRRFLGEVSGWELEAEQSSLPDQEKGPWDGGYAARLRRAGAAPS